MSFLPADLLDTMPAFVDDMSLAESLLRVLRAPSLRAELAFGPLLSPEAWNRRDLASAARANALELPASGVATDRLPRWRGRLALTG